MAGRERNGIPWDEPLNLVNILNAPAVVETNCWEDVGLELGVEEHELERIKIECQGKINECKKEMFRHWLRHHPHPSWEKVSHALRTAKDRSHDESELENKVRSLETNSKRLKCCVIVLVTALVIAIIFSTFICGLLIVATFIVGWVVAMIEEEKKELKSEILKRTLEVFAPDQLHQTDRSHCHAKTDTSDMSEMDCQGLFLSCLAKTTKSVHTKDCSSASAVKSVHPMNLDPNSLTRWKLRVGSVTETSDMSDQVKVCPGASEMKSVHAMNRLDPNSLTHQKMRVVSATDLQHV